MKKEDKAIALLIGVMIINCIGTFVWANVWRPEGVSFDTAQLSFYICFMGTGNAIVTWLKRGRKDD